MSDLTVCLPMITLRGMTILPHMVIHFDVSRKQSIKSVNYAMKNGQKIFLITQKSADIMNPEREDLFDVGTVCEIKQMVKMPGNLVRVLVKGISRARLLELHNEEELLSADIIPCPDEEALLSDAQRDARISLLKEMMKHYYTVAGRNQGDNINRLDAITGLEEIIYKSVSECTTEFTERQEILETDNLLEQFDAACDMVCQEIEVNELKSNLAEDVKKRVDHNQKEYILREQIRAIKEELGEDDEDEIDEFKNKVSELNASDEIKDKIIKEIRRYEALPGSSSEAAVVRTYIETMLELPWNNFSTDNIDILKVEKVLYEDHYGLLKVKERILEFLAVKALNNKGETPIICLLGPPGTGKTSIAASIARALNRKYVRICLGGVRDEAEIRGHRKTYVGAMPGRIITGLITAGVGNPLMLLDEIDKVGTDSRGDTASALLEILDGEQNSRFRDHYIEAPVDLSKVLFIATANDTSTIPKPLLDRMEIIEINSYTSVEKFHIAKDYLVKKQLDKNGLQKKQLSFTDKAIRKIIDNYTREAGVRSLERQIGKVCRKAAKQILSGEKLTHKITVSNLDGYLGVEKYSDENTFAEDMVGIVKGLAWTSVGGTTLDVEAVVMPGKGVLTVTGQLGDVMKESATVALGYVRYVAGKYGIDPEVFEKNDIQLHVPEGAVPKDGPSAGITITLAMLSALTKRTVRHDVAMTGEITLHGNVLPIGGLKEKLLAAKKAGIKTVIVPEKNKKDISEIESEITEDMTIRYVSHMDEVVKTALNRQEKI